MAQKNQDYWSLVQAVTWIYARADSAAPTIVSAVDLNDLWGKLQSGEVELFGCVDGADITKIPPVALTAYQPAVTRADAIGRPLSYVAPNAAPSIWIRSKNTYPGSVVNDRSWPAGVARAPAFQDRYFREIVNARVAVADIKRIWPPNGMPVVQPATRVPGRARSRSSADQTAIMAVFEHLGWLQHRPHLSKKEMAARIQRHDDLSTVSDVSVKAAFKRLEQKTQDTLERAISRFLAGL